MISNHGYAKAYRGIPLPPPMARCLMTAMEAVGKFHPLVGTALPDLEEGVMELEVVDREARVRITPAAVWRQRAGADCNVAAAVAGAAEEGGGNLTGAVQQQGADQLAKEPKKASPS